MRIQNIYEALSLVSITVRFLLNLVYYKSVMPKTINTIAFGNTAALAQSNQFIPKKPQNRLNYDTIDRRSNLPQVLTKNDL